MNEFENLKHIIGQTVHYQRTGKGWTQQRLAEATGLKRTTVSNIEAGRQSLTLEQFCLISSVLGAKAGDVLEMALRRISTEDRWHTVAGVVTASKVQEKVVRNHILDTLK